MKAEAIEAPKDAVEAFRKEDPNFCQFLEESGRIVSKEDGSPDQAEFPKGALQHDNNQQ
jgi:hypothetical protein